MNILRWILAYPSAVAVWLFFPMLFLPFVPQDWASPGTDGPIGFLELVLILPYSTRLCLTAGIVAFSILSVIGSLLVAFVFLFGASLSAVVWTLVSHICGTVAGTLLSFALIPARSLDR
jgi:hypothetical protein